MVTSNSNPSSGPHPKSRRVPRILSYPHDPLRSPEPQQAFLRQNSFLTQAPLPSKPRSAADSDSDDADADSAADSLHLKPRSAADSDDFAGSADSHTHSAAESLHSKPKSADDSRQNEELEGAAAESGDYDDGGDNDDGYGDDDDDGDDDVDNDDDDGNEELEGAGAESDGTGNYFITSQM